MLGGGGGQRRADPHVSAIQLSNQSDSKKRIKRSSLPELSWFCVGAALRNMDGAALLTACSFQQCMQTLPHDLLPVTCEALHNMVF